MENAYDELRNIRVTIGETQRSIAEKLDISESYYSLIESRQRRPSIKVATQIEKVIGIPWTRFFDE